MSPVPTTTADDSGSSRPEWTFLTNHAHVLHCVFRDPTVRTRDIAQAVGITERRTQAILKDLEEGGYLSRTRSGRRNTYSVNHTALFRHPLEAHRAVGDLLTLLEAPHPMSHDSHTT